MRERRAWTDREDRILKELYEQRGIQRWAEISKVMEGEFGLGGRNGKQCRERYHNHLQDCIRHEKWGQEEERVLVRQQGELGNRWAEISKFLPGRSENDIKNQFYSILRRGLRQINTAIRKQLKRYKQLQISVLNKIVEACEPTSRRKKDKSIQINGHASLKSVLTFYAFHSDSFTEEDLSTIKKFIDGVKLISKSNKKKKSKEAEAGEKESDEEIESAELRDDCPIEEIKKDEPEQKFRKSSLFTFTLETPEAEQAISEPKGPYKLRKRSSFCSNHSFDLSSPKWNEFIDPFKVFDLQSTDNLSPRPQTFLNSPYFDQTRAGFGGNNSQFYH